MESVPYGTVFLTSSQQYIEGGSFYVPMDIDKATEAFVDDLNTGAVAITHKPDVLVDELVKSHGLVIVNKSSSLARMSPKSDVVKLSGTDYWYEINGVDGDFTFEQVKSYITRGLVKPQTLIKVLDADYKELTDYTPANKISSLQKLFTTATEPPSEITDTKPAITIVAKSPQSVMRVRSSIESYFDVEPQDMVMYCQNLKQAIDGKGVVKPFQNIEKQPKRA
jgi:hypothetical protein